MMKKFAAAAVCLGMGIAAQAAVVTVDVLGEIRYDMLSGQQGQQIRVSFSYDTATPAWQFGPSHAGYQLALPHFVQAEFGQHRFQTQSTWIDVFNNLQGNVQDMLDVGGDLDGSESFACDSCYFGLRLASAWNNRTALRNTRLPFELDIARFDAEGFNVGGIYSRAAAPGQDTQLHFEILSISTVADGPAPVHVAEPGSAALAGLAVLVLLGQRNGRRRDLSKP